MNTRVEMLLIESKNHWRSNPDLCTLRILPQPPQPCFTVVENFKESSGFLRVSDPSNEAPGQGGLLRWVQVVMTEMKAEASTFDTIAARHGWASDELASMGMAADALDSFTRAHGCNPPENLYEFQRQATADYRIESGVGEYQFMAYTSSSGTSPATLAVQVGYRGLQEIPWLLFIDGNGYTRHSYGDSIECVASGKCWSILGRSYMMCIDAWPYLQFPLTMPSILYTRRLSRGIFYPSLGSVEEDLNLPAGWPHHH